MRIIIALFPLFLALFTGCTAAPSQTVIETAVAATIEALRPTATWTPEATDLPPTNTPPPTATPRPTLTPTLTPPPTSTPVPTLTPLPTPTATRAKPTPVPIAVIQANEKVSVYIAPDQPTTFDTLSPADQVSVIGRSDNSQ